MEANPLPSSASPLPSETAELPPDPGAVTSASEPAHSRRFVHAGVLGPLQRSRHRDEPLLPPDHVGSERWSDVQIDSPRSEVVGSEGGPGTPRTPPAPARAGFMHAAANVASAAGRRLAGAGRTFWQQSDVRTLVARGRTNEFLARLREPDPLAAAPAIGEAAVAQAHGAEAHEIGVARAPEEALPGARLAVLVRSAGEMKARLADPALALPPALVTTFHADLDKVVGALQALQTDRTGVGAVAKRAFWIAGASLSTAALALTVPLATKPRQSLFAAELVGLLTKMLVEAGVMIGMPTTDFGLFKERWLSRNMINLEQAVYFMPSVFKPRLNKSVPYNVGGGLTSVAFLFGAFMHDEIRGAVTGRLGLRRHPGLADAGREMTPAAREGLEGLMRGVRLDMASLAGTKEDFEARHEINPLVSKQVNLAVDVYRQLGDKMMSALDLDPEIAQANPDFKAKLALAVFTAVICFASAALMYPDTIGVVDLGSDAIFTSAFQMSLAFKGSVSRRDALDEFKTFSGFSVVLLAMLAANKAGDDFLSKGTSGMLVGMLSMSALNMLAPGPVGTASARLIEKLMNLSGADIGNALWSVGDHVFNLMAGGRMPSAVEIRELDGDEDLEAGHGVA